MLSEHICSQLDTIKDGLKSLAGDVLVGLLVSKRYKNIWTPISTLDRCGMRGFQTQFYGPTSILMPLRSNCQVCAGYELLFLYTCFLHFLYKQPIATMNAFEERLLEGVCRYPHRYNSSHLTHGVFPLVLNTRKCISFRVDRHINTDMGEKLI